MFASLTAATGPVAVQSMDGVIFIRQICEINHFVGSAAYKHSLQNELPGSILGCQDRPFTHSMDRRPIFLMAAVNRILDQTTPRLAHFVCACLYGCVAIWPVVAQPESPPAPSSGSVAGEARTLPCKTFRQAVLSNGSTADDNTRQDGLQPSPTIPAQASAVVEDKQAPDDKMKPVQETNPLSKMPAGAREIAINLGIASPLDKFLALKTQSVPNSSMSLEMLILRQELTERLVMASLDLRGVMAELDDEIMSTQEVAERLVDKEIGQSD